MWDISYTICKTPFILLKLNNISPQILGVVIFTQQFMFNICQHDYRPQRICIQGYVFTRVCDSVNKGGVSEADPPGADPRSRHQPGSRHHPPYGYFNRYKRSLVKMVSVTMRSLSVCLVQRQTQIMIN